MATGPIDYLGMFPQQDFLRDIQGGLQVGSAFRQLQDQRAAAERAQQRQQQYMVDVQEAMKSPTPQAFAALTLKYPQQREAFAAGWKTLGEAQQKDELGLASQAYAALNSNRPDVAQKLLEKRIEAMKNSGQPTQDFEPLLELVKTNPEQAKGYAGLVLSHVMGPEKFGATFKALGEEERAQAKAPAELEEAKAKAETEKVKAKFAQSNAMLDLEKKGWDIKKIGADIDLQREANRISAMNAATAREGNTLKRQELSLKVQEAQTKLDDKIREKVATAEAGAGNIDNMLNTVERIKTNKSLNDVLGSIEGRLPAVFGDEASDAIALIDTLGSQAFLAQIPNIKGMGALSNAEGEKLQSALQNLSRTQSEKQFRANLDEASRLLKKGRENLSRSTGVPLGKPDIPAAPGARPPLSTFQR